MDSDSAQLLSNLSSLPWFKQLPLPQQSLLFQSVDLINLCKHQQIVFYDYGFAVMPAAKAYEGFIKELVYGLGLITEQRYRGKRFRVGKALNPEIAHHSPDRFEVLYDDISNACGGEKIASQLWNTWIECRNHVFHYFVDKGHFLTLPEAENRVKLIIDTIDRVYLSCPWVKKVFN